MSDEEIINTKRNPIHQTLQSSPNNSVMNTDREWSQFHETNRMTKPLMKNLMEYGMQDKVPQILLN